MVAGKQAPGRAFCPQCGQKYAVPEEQLKEHPGLRFRASCRQCGTPFNVRWQDDALITDLDELEQADAIGSGRNVLPRGARVGKYEVEELIASGGSATIYKAFEMGANRTVALKVLHRAADSDYGVRFRREVEVQGNLKHPNLMPIFDQGSVDGQPYYTMELLQKPTTLETIVSLHRSRRMAYNALLRGLDSIDALLRRVLLPVARAVEFANRHGVIHRDIKPGNIILDATTRHVYVIDFGICNVSGQAGQRLVLRGQTDSTSDAAPDHTAAMGTARFMPPEQARGDVSKQGDVWALGAMLYYILSGDSPIASAIDLGRVGAEKRVANLRRIASSSRTAGDEEEATFYERRIEDLQSGSARTMRDVLKDAQNGHYQPLPDGTNPALAAIAARAMAREPADRYATADRFADDVTRYLEGRAVGAYVSSLGAGRAALYKAREHIKRNRNPVIAGGVALLLGVLLVVFLAVKGSSDRRKQVAAWISEARNSSDPTLQEDRLTKALALEPDNEEGAELLALVRKYLPIREKLQNARAARKQVRALRAERKFDEAAQLAEDTAAVLEGSVLPDLRSLPQSFPGRLDEQGASDLAAFLRGRRIVRVRDLPSGVTVSLVPPRSRNRTELAWDAAKAWGTTPLMVGDHAIERGSYVLVVARDQKAIHLPFVITHQTPRRAELSCPMDPRDLPEGMVYVSGRRAMPYGDLRFRESRQRVEVAPFYLDAYEVSNRQYARFLNALDPGLRILRAPRRLLPGPGNRTDPLWEQDAGGVWNFAEGTANEPVTSISYLDAAAYARWAKKRLPTPQEWECAARGLDGRDYPFGDQIDPEGCNAHTGVVAAITEYRKDRAPCGAYQMGGNVAEWTDDSGNDQAMVKGGSFDLPRYRVIISSFGERRADLPQSDVGFRCARGVP